MKYVFLDQLSEGDRLAENVCDPEGRLMLREGVVLNARLIEGLKRLRIGGVRIVDVAPGGRQRKQTGTGQGSSAAHHRPEDIRHEAVSVLAEAFRQVSETGDFDDKPVLQTATRMAQYLKENRNQSFNLVAPFSDADRLLQHSVNVCMMAVLTAYTLGCTEEQVHQLAVGALLHDIGLAVPGMADPKREHILQGYNILRKHVHIPVASRHIVLQHHEKLNGQGIPNGTGGEKFRKLSQLCAVANDFDSFLNRRGYSRLPHEGVEYIMSHADRSYDIAIVRAFVTSVAPYPVGTYVKLSNGLEGTVCGFPRSLPFRPSILLSDRNETFHLVHHNTVFVRQVLSSQKTS